MLSKWKAFGIHTKTIENEKLLVFYNYVYVFKGNCYNTCNPALFLIVSISLLSDCEYGSN